MIKKTNIRAALFTAFLATTTAMAAPSFAQDAGGLPNISPDQIARDVSLQYNQRTGEKEFVAASFDPFEQDPGMAGSAALRSTTTAISIDGERLNGGAILDLGFYYNSASNDPYDIRGLDQAVFLSGQPASIIKRDSRVLECSNNVDQVVYDHTEYYRPSVLVSLYRPYRHYSGHYGYDYWDRPYYRGGYGHGYGGNGWRRRPGRTGRGTGRRGGFSDRVVDRACENSTSAACEGRTDRRRPRDREGIVTDRDSSPTTRRPDRRRPSSSDDVVDRPDVDRRRERGSRSSRVAPGKVDAAARPISRRRPATSGNSRARVGTASSPSSRPTARPAPTSRPAPTTRSRPAPSRSAPSPKRAATPVSRPRPKARSSAPKRSGGFAGRAKAKAESRRLNFFPNQGYSSREVVTSRSSACAREEMLSVFIPDDRLQAARFDGLTVLVLDRSGTEYPVFVPPNYIEGFSLARSGRIIATGIDRRDFQQPREANPLYEPRPVERQFEGQPERLMAECPTGTTPQPDGTCLQAASYPQR